MFEYLQVIREVNVGDMAQALLPTFPMTVYYGNERVFNGREFKACDVDIAPRVFIGGGPSELYTLIMIDPDAPDPNDRLMQCVVFRIVSNIRGGTSHSQGTEVVPYEASSPEVDKLVALNVAANTPVVATDVVTLAISSIPHDN
ncbi:unnamed protein product [Lactuca virosa]|uniref:Uncharacterized protein n=1 Tax=Lactuca virosa TaxID=75947 RepID=A0AAU9P886_9ASTR|nr:unnamed protein product [Lactuca virosa]